jgi:hypothetical protein
LAVEGVDEPVVVHVAGRHGLLLAGLAGDRAGPGVVLAGSGVGVAGLVIAELGKHQGAEHDAQAGLAAVNLSVREPVAQTPRVSMSKVDITVGEN